MKGETFKISSQETIPDPNCSKQLIPKKFVIVPGFFCDGSNEEKINKYLDLIRSKLFVYEPENKFEVNFLLNKEKGEIKSYLKSIKQPFIVLLLREISMNDFVLYEKFAKKNKHCKVYYEGKKENLLRYEDEEIKEEKISMRNICNFEEKLELFIMLTKRELDDLVHKDMVHVNFQVEKN